MDAKNCADVLFTWIRSDDHNPASVIRPEMRTFLGSILFNKSKQKELALQCSNMNEHYPKEQRYEAYRKFFGKWKRIDKELRAELAASNFTDTTVHDSPKEKTYTAYHTARSDLKVYYELLKSNEVSRAVAVPEAMPVTVPDADEVDPFFDLLKQPLDDSVLDQKAPVKITDPNAKFHGPPRAVKFCTMKQAKRGTVFSDGRMDFCKQVTGEQHIRELIDSIRDQPHVTKFLLGNNIMGQAGCEAVASFLQDSQKKCQIKVWYLAGNAIDSAGLTRLCNAWLRDTWVEQIWLKRNPLGLEAGATISKLLSDPWCSLQVLDLHNTFLQDRGVEDLFNGLLANISLKTLYLDANALTSKTGHVIGDYLSQKAQNSCPGINHLSVGMNRLGDEGIEAIFGPILRQGASYTSLTSLNLNSNRFGSKGLKMIVAALPLLPNLQVLDIGAYKATADLGELPNHFEDVDSLDLLDQLIRCNESKLRLLQMETCHLPLSSVLQLSYSFMQNSSLWHVLWNQPDISSDERVKHAYQLVNQHVEKNRSMNVTRDMLRALKHGQHVEDIDSIYRTNNKR